MVGAAASYYKATLAVTTGLSAPFNNLAVIYKQQVLACSRIKWLNWLRFLDVVLGYLLIADRYFLHSDLLSGQLWRCNILLQRGSSY